MPLNVQDDAFHCPLTVHPQGYSDMLPGFKKKVQP